MLLNGEKRRARKKKIEKMKKKKKKKKQKETSICAHTLTCIRDSVDCVIHAICDFARGLEGDDACARLCAFCVPLQGRYSKKRKK